MNFNVRVNVHATVNINDNRKVLESLEEIKGSIEEVTEKLGEIMATGEEIKASLVAIGVGLDELAVDIADLLAKIPTEGTISASDAAEIRASAEALLSRVTSLASQHTPVVAPPVDPPVDPPVEGEEPSFRRNR